MRRRKAGLNRRRLETGGALLGAVVKRRAGLKTLNTETGGVRFETAGGGAVETTAGRGLTRRAGLERRGAV